MQGTGEASMGGALDSAEDVRAALNAHSKTGTPVLVLVESVSGLAGQIRDLIPDDLKPVRRAVGAKATQAKVGCVADTLDLDSHSDEAIVVENAQWADPTSMGRLQRLMAGASVPPLMVIAHIPLPDEDRWWLEQFAAAGSNRGTLLRTTIEADPPGEPPSNDQERDLVVASSQISIPMSVPVVAALLDTGDSEALEIAERLVKRGLLAETRSGFQASPAGLSVEAGEARRGHLAARLAAVLEGAGEDPAVVGALQLSAGDAGSAYPHLRDAARTAQTGGAGGETYHLASAALTAAKEAGVGSREELGELHLMCGRFLAAGRSEEAVEHLEQAVALLEGPARIDALGFSAAVADNRQHPQDSERLLAIAEWEAVTQGELAKLGSLGTFRALELNRIGFSREADASLEKANVLLAEHGTELQRFNAVRNRAWIMFDRGQVTQAETEFTRLRDLTDSNDLAGLADRDAWLARCFFATGHPREALDAVDTARRLASEAAVEAPLFLTDLALVEGFHAFGHHEDALHAADRVWDIVERQLPSWRNIARFARARALFNLGRKDEAASEVEAALQATPPGANGWRWRSRCQALQVEIGLADRSTPKREAEDLADGLFQAELYGWAAELKCAIAEQTDDAEAAQEAMALAVYLGNPMLAARAAHAGKLWKDRAAGPVIRSVRAIGDRLPDDWEDAWAASPLVAAAMAAPEPTEDEEGRAENLAVLEDALTQAGLRQEDVVLSPAQRRAGGLVRYSRRRLRPVAMLAAAFGVVVLAGGTAFAVSQMTAPETPEPDPPTVEATVTTLPLTLEETLIEVPVDGLFFGGSSPHRGDYGRSGFVDVSGPRSVDGYYWMSRTASSIDATPVVHGNNLLVGSADRTFYAIDLTTGALAWQMPIGDQVLIAAGLGRGDLGESTLTLVIVIGDDGTVTARDPVSADASTTWGPRELGARVRSSPVVDGQHVYVATQAGVVHALDLATGSEAWRYPEPDDEPLGRVVADLALDDGVIYVGTQDGALHLINTDGTHRCETTLPGPVTVTPVVAGGEAFISVLRTLFIFPAGECVEVFRADQYNNPDSDIEIAPAVVDNLIYLPSRQFLFAIDRTKIGQAVGSPAELEHWSAGTVRVDGSITSPPVVTRDAVYFGTENGSVYAVDSDTGDFLWEEPWKTNSTVRAAPVVVDGAVYITTLDGRIYAVGPDR